MFNPVDIKRSSKFESSYWEVYSVKLKRIVHIFGDLPYDYWVLIESNPRIKNYCESPLVPNYQKVSSERQPYFNMWIQWQDNTEEFVKIKYSKELNPNNPRSKNLFLNIQAQKKWCEENGYIYSIKTEIEIRNNLILLDNLKRIIAYTRNKSYPVESHIIDVVDSLNNGSNSIKDIQYSLKHLTPSELNEAIFWLIYEGRVNSNIDIKPINPDTKVWLING